jgi:hypothetical protein
MVLLGGGLHELGLELLLDPVRRELRLLLDVLAGASFGKRHGSKDLLVDLVNWRDIIAKAKGTGRH